MYRTNIRSVTQQEENKRTKILNTMLGLVVRQGIQATPMSQVIKESGVAAGTIYHHFSSKEEIINELYLNMKQGFGKVFIENEYPTLDYKSLFFHIWKNLYEYFCENETAFHFAEQIGHCTMITPETRQKGEVYYLPIIQFFSTGVTQNYLREMDLNLMSKLIYGNIVTAVQLTLSGELIMTQERLQTVIQSSWDSVAKH